MNEYRLLQDQVATRLSKEVTRLLNKNWTLQGGPIVNGPDIVQAITRTSTDRLALADSVGDEAKQLLKNKALLPIPTGSSVETLKARLLKADPDFLGPFEDDEAAFIVRRLFERLVGH